MLNILLNFLLLTIYICLRIIFKKMKLDLKTIRTILIFITTLIMLVSIKNSIFTLLLILSIIYFDYQDKKLNRKINKLKNELTKIYKSEFKNSQFYSNIFDINKAYLSTKENSNLSLVKLIRIDSKNNYDFIYVFYDSLTNYYIDFELLDFRDFNNYKYYLYEIIPKNLDNETELNEYLESDLID